MGGRVDKHSMTCRKLWLWGAGRWAGRALSTAARRGGASTSSSSLCSAATTSCAAPSLAAAETGGAARLRALSWWPREAAQQASLGRAFAFTHPPLSPYARDPPPLMLLRLIAAVDGLREARDRSWGLSAPVAPAAPSGAARPLELSSVRKRRTPR